RPMVPAPLPGGRAARLAGPRGPGLAGLPPGGAPGGGRGPRAGPPGGGGGAARRPRGARAGAAAAVGPRGGGPPPPAPTARRGPLALLLGFLGAGVYEEALFRLLLVPLFFATLRLLQAPAVLASTLAVTASALLFSLAHHAGMPGESFTWFAFIFRWLAGVYF